jgi:small subunit ribosomal protein S20
MAHHKSALKRIRTNQTKRLNNRFYLKTTRTYLKKLKKIQDKVEAEALFKKVASLLDKLAKKNVIHKNNAGNHKSKLQRMVNSL